MSQTFRSFLETASEIHSAFLDESILVVSLIGKDSNDWRKADIVNNLCYTSALIGQNDPDNPEIFVSFFSLKLTGIQR